MRYMNPRPTNLFEMFSKLEHNIPVKKEVLVYAHLNSSDYTKYRNQKEKRSRENIKWVHKFFSQPIEKIFADAGLSSHEQA